MLEAMSHDIRTVLWWYFSSVFSLIVKSPNSIVKCKVTYKYVGMGILLVSIAFSESSFTN